MIFSNRLKSGQAHIRAINEDRVRVRFAKQLLNNQDLRFELTDIQGDFLVRIEAEHDKPVPDIHIGDRNIIDSLRRRFEGRLA